MTMAQAAKRLGVSVDTIRRRVRSGELEAHKESTPQGFRWLVVLPSDAGARAARAADVTGVAGEADVLREMVGLLREQLDARTREVQELHTLLAQARGLPAPGEQREPEQGAEHPRRTWRWPWQHA